MMILVFLACAMAKKDNKIKKSDENIVPIVRMGL